MGLQLPEQAEASRTRPAPREISGLRQVELREPEQAPLRAAAGALAWQWGAAPDGGAARVPPAPHRRPAGQSAANRPTLFGASDPLPSGIARYRKPGRRYPGSDGAGDV